MSWLDRIPIFGRMFRKSKGEREIVALFPSIGNIPISWTANRYELVSQGAHGWNYVAINAIAESVAEMTPRVAWVRPEDAVREAKEKFLAGAHQNKRLHRERSQRFATKYLSSIVRKKAMVAELQIGDELEPVPTSHRLVRLLNKPNSRDNWWTFSYRLMFFLRSAGGCYLRVVNGNDGQPSELWVIPPQWVRPIMDPAKGKLISGYEVRPSFAGGDIGAGWFQGGGGRETWTAEEMIQIGYPHPFSMVDFLSPLSAGSEWVDIGSSIDRSRIARFQNSSMPGIVIEMDKDVADPKPDQIDRIKADIQNKYAGVRRTGEPIILAPGIRMVSVDKTPVEMDWVNSANQNADWIMALHKTGKSVVGMAEQTTLASMVASRANFFQTAVRAPLKLIGATLTADLCNRFDEEGLTCYFEDPTPTDPAQHMAELNSRFDRGVITPNEYRAELGLSPFAHGGDDPMVPMNLSPIGFESGEDPQDLPLPAVAAEHYDEDGSAQGGATDAPGEPSKPPGFGLGMEGKSFERNSFHRFKAIKQPEPPPVPVTKKEVEAILAWLPLLGF